MQRNTHESQVLCKLRTTVTASLTFFQNIYIGTVLPPNERTDNLHFCGQF